MMDVPEQHSLLAEATGRRGVCHASLYADHVVLFLNPDPQECDIILCLLMFFGVATGLHMKS